MHRLVQREAVDHRRRRQHRDLQHVLEAVEQRAAPVVVDVAVGDRQHVVGSERGQRRVGLLGRDLEALELLVGREPRRDPLGLPAERLADEAAGPEGARPAVVDGVREIEGVLRARHRDVGEAPLLGDVVLARRRRRLRQRLGQRQRVGAHRAGDPLVGAVDQEDDRELEALRLVDREHVHALGRRLEVRGDWIVPRLAQQLEVRNEERGPVRRQRPRGRVDEPEELRDVLALLLRERRVRVEVAREQLGALEELVRGAPRSSAPRRAARSSRGRRTSDFAAAVASAEKPDSARAISSKTSRSGRCRRPLASAARASSTAGNA